MYKSKIKQFYLQWNSYICMFSHILRFWHLILAGHHTCSSIEVCYDDLSQVLCYWGHWLTWLIAHSQGTTVCLSLWIKHISVVNLRHNDSHNCTNLLWIMVYRNTPRELPEIIFFYLHPNYFESRKILRERVATKHELSDIPLSLCQDLS